MSQHEQNRMLEWVSLMLVLVLFHGVDAQFDPRTLPLCPSGIATSCVDRFCSEKCPAFPDAPCYKRGCDGNCDLVEFFIGGVQLKPEMCRDLCKGKWTQWYDRDNPGGLGDYETLPALRREHPGQICDNPTIVDARAIVSNVPASLTGQVTQQSSANGFWCLNKDNVGNCLNYNRFCCEDVPAPQCPDGAWTRFFDRDDPSGVCDCESLPSLRVDYPDAICDNPTAIDVRLVSNGEPAHTAGQVIAHSNPTQGFRCNNVGGQTCLDYKVRFCCPKKPPPTCVKNGWTPWINVDSPNGKCDCEHVNTIRQNNPDLLCENPTDIDARVWTTLESYLTVNQVVDVSLANGLTCNNVNQDCLDYEVRFCCPDQSIPDSKCKNGKWTQFFNWDKPGGRGDYETLTEIRKLSPKDVCPKPTNVDVRVAATGDSYLTAEQNVNIDPETGFFCVNEHQNGEFCDDYKIRFCCPNVCEEPKCPGGDWTEFYNDGQCDCELINNYGSLP